MGLFLFFNTKASQKRMKELENRYKTNYVPPNMNVWLKDAYKKFKKANPHLKGAGSYKKQMRFK